MSTEKVPGIFQTVFDFFCSLKLSVVILSLALVLVFAGTLAQEPLGLYLTQDRFFHSFFVDYASMAAAGKKFLQMFGVYLTPSTAMEVMAAPRIPVFPGGYTIGFAFLFNLIASQIRTFELSRTKFGLQLIHLGLILLLVGQLATDLFARESSMHIREGESKNYSEVDTYCELAVVDVSYPDKDRVTVIPQGILASEREIKDPNLPFTIRVNKFYRNSEVQAGPRNAAVQPPSTQGFGAHLNVRELPHETQMGRRDLSSAIIELVTPEGSLGTWLVSMWLEEAQPVTFGGRQYLLSLRPERLYKDYSLHLLSFTHERYAGTDIPKDFSSRVRLKNVATGEDREVRIFMNNPLRYQGDTYFQASYDKDEKGTLLQVVRNPGWLTPYIGCIVISLGLLMQFGSHMFQFLVRRREA
jgi:hypothetical protein